ncbi:putative toxin-antitoxin system toxin component, PIN family [Duganella levis]|uniref:Toxin-antitoxin system toxin component, PIN family n=1 Tax=Duganella levis TaxID=2692169 RepID=A0ABW9VZB2_9BURK|nr:putative toxin-antitoxin system toxin component, PIN family [Duganella levis]MYN27003.1 putative toxin-antitoxin system toxin component, PIN family [Duganella levis]
MRFVLDTNTVISGALWLGTPHLLMDAVRANRFTPCTCREILFELLGVLHRQKFAARMTLSGKSARRIVIEYRRLALLVVLPPLIPKVSRDPKDDAILACAVQAQADAIVSGDKDLLSLVLYQKIPILTPIQALNYLP